MVAAVYPDTHRRPGLPGRHHSGKVQPAEAEVRAHNDDLTWRSDTLVDQIADAVPSTLPLALSISVAFREQRERIHAQLTGKGINRIESQVPLTSFDAGQISGRHP